jgi:oligopeptide/dipeptide ABC transporter ATP-binding protein
MLVDLMAADLILSARGLQVHYQHRGTLLRAVDGVSVDLFRGETLGVIGESGSGKSTLARALLLLAKPSAGSILYHSPGRPPVELMTARAAVLKRYRPNIQGVFQNAAASLDPHMPVGEILAEPLLELGIESRRTVSGVVPNLLAAVGLPAEFARRKPRQLSGGEGQRVAIARAIGPRPQVIIADEPTSALDVGTEAAIVRLLRRLQRELGFSILFITHRLRAVQALATRLAVMYAGEIVENGPAVAVEKLPLAPYTRALIASTPALDPTRDRTRPQVLISKETPPVVHQLPGCRFQPRCPWSIPECASLKPRLREILPGRFAACIRIGASEPDIERAASKGLRM